MGLSDVIVDIIETGTTLRENDLAPLEDIVPVSARLIANQVSYQFKHAEIDRLCRDLDQFLAQRQEEKK